MLSNMPRVRHLAFTILLALGLMACSSETETAGANMDASVNAGPDMASDASDTPDASGLTEDAAARDALVEDAQDVAALDQGPVAEPGFTIAAGTQRGSIESGGRTRAFNIRIPPDYDGETALPLLLVFHGGGGDGARLQNMLGFDAYTDRDGAIAVYPDGVENNWADGRGTTDASQAGVDDVAFVADLIDHLATHLNVDANRIWATGISNGGFFTQHLACELSERFAAVAPVISALPTAALETCRPTNPLPMLAIQGTEDAFITFEGGDAGHDRFNLGDGGAIESADTTRAFWAERAGCDPEPVVTALDPVNAQDPTRVTLYAYRGCEAGARIDYYIVSGMGHVWPPDEGTSPRVTGPTSTQLDATSLVWAFFNEGS